MRKIYVPYDSMFDLIQTNKAEFYDRENYCNQKIQIEGERFSVVNDNYSISLIKSDYMELLLKRSVEISSTILVLN